MSNYDPSEEDEESESWPPYLHQDEKRKDANEKLPVLRQDVVHDADGPI
jgi:hypothetical protein